MKLEWSAVALADRNLIFDFIEQDRPRAAVSVDEAIEAKTDRLKEFPGSGRVGRVDGTHELVVVGLPYAILGDTVLILRVLYSAREWPDELPH